MNWLVRLLIVILVVAYATSATAQTVSAMRGQRRILLIATPDAQDPKSVQQRRLLSGWSQQAADRDISLVEVAGSRVTGATDEAGVLRKRFGLPLDLFQVLLIGKDGHVALRSREPVRAETLQGAIDAMPLRQAGER